MPAITLLSLSECDAPMFLEMLIVAPTGHLCPLLEALHLQESYVRQSLLVDIINSRRPQMMHVQITRCSGIDEYTASELRSLAKIGWVK
ncbi:hypothetical protein BOTBODRAFT_31149 [Botryobasidium botryosum FD-172 SS1]|uniref:Uncharacterized protein n=1 Tax=Botryobasidium botryosum (strain FD-172 SS1) TaxID=930990 RepID=A0A067MKJ2_BOTB1|nr:hypothetical protein BOTBODRAFT_31149 [Botryobasidium botryosum FD-172 SS1]